MKCRFKVDRKKMEKNNKFIFIIFALLIVLLIAIIYVRYRYFSFENKLIPDINSFLKLPDKGKAVLLSSLDKKEKLKLLKDFLPTRSFRFPVNNGLIFLKNGTIKFDWLTNEEDPTIQIAASKTKKIF
jgi:hypothetical protein